MLYSLESRVNVWRGSLTSEEIIDVMPPFGYNTMKATPSAIYIDTMHVWTTPTGINRHQFIIQFSDIFFIFKQIIIASYFSLEKSIPPGGCSLGWKRLVSLYG